jgi:hypothetical protein
MYRIIIMGSSTGMLLSYEIIRLTSNSKDETVLIEELFLNTYTLWNG